MNSRKKCPRVPRRTPRPGPGTGMPRRGNPGKRRRQTSSLILYETGEVAPHGQRPVMYRSRSTTLLVHKCHCCEGSTKSSAGSHCFGLHSYPVHTSVVDCTHSPQPHCSPNVPSNVPSNVRSDSYRFSTPSRRQRHVQARQLVPWRELGMAAHLMSACKTECNR